MACARTIGHVTAVLFGFCSCISTCIVAGSLGLGL